MALPAPTGILLEVYSGCGGRHRQLTQLGYVQVREPLYSLLTAITYFKQLYTSQSFTVTLNIRY